MSNYQLTIVYHYIIAIGNIGKLVPNLFDKEKDVIHYENLQIYLSLGLKVKNIWCIRIRSITMDKTICWIQQTKKNKNRKNGDKNGKVFYNLINNAVYGKTMGKLRNRMDVKFVRNRTEFLKWILKLSYVVHKMFDNEFSCNT